MHAAEFSFVSVPLKNVIQDRILIPRWLILYLLHMRITLNTGEAERDGPGFSSSGLKVK